MRKPKHKHMNLNYFAAKSDLGTADRYSGHAADKRDGRSDFAIDRDRILYSKAFRRLSDKTQVFFSDEIKDLRTRLTHTLEVNQIAKTIVSSLGCKTDLTEAIALRGTPSPPTTPPVSESTVSMGKKRTVNQAFTTTARGTIGARC